MYKSKNIFGVKMPFRKIERVLESLGYEEDAVVMFTIRRFERLDSHHIKLNISEVNPGFIGIK